uniref:Chemokine interleukin-8-like domain-containing protein n=1 Tax=Mola mola TaxID=94237 RepID=A0A3Q3WQK1_MOLML
MNSAVIVCLSCLLAFGAQGQLINTSTKCKCLNGYVSNRLIPLRLIKAGPVIYHPNIFCQHMEIIIELKKKNVCVDPESPLGKLTTCLIACRHSTSGCRGGVQQMTWVSLKIRKLRPPARPPRIL